MKQHLALAIVIAIVSISVIIRLYNRLITQIETVRNSQKQIDIQLDRRLKIFESLINVVKKYMDFEQSTLKDIVALRNQAQQAKSTGNDKRRIDAENKISDIASNIHMVFEQYPELKSNQNCMQLQEEIVSTENKLSYAKQAYNDSIEVYYANKNSFPSNLIASCFSAKLDFNFNYWQLSQEKISEQESYTVKL